MQEEAMGIAVGFDVAKEVHWVAALDETGALLLDRAVRNDPDDLDRLAPRRGAPLTAEFLVEAGDLRRFADADALAAAAGLAPVLRQAGKVRFLRRALGGNKALKRVFYQSAFCSLGSPASRAFYARKRREGKRGPRQLL